MLETLQNKFKITNTNLHASIVTLYNVNLKKQLSNGFKRSFYWNIYQIIPAKEINQELTHELLCASFQGVKRLFVLAYTNAANAANNEAGIKDNRKYFLTKAEIKNYNALIDGKFFYDQPINDLIKQYDDVRNVSAGQLMIILQGVY